MNSDEYHIKSKIALENMRFLVSNGILFEDKKVLDIGFGLGFNSKMMRKLNGDAYLPPVSETIEPYFGNMKVSNSACNFGNRCFIVATQPVKELEVNRRVK